MIYFAFIAILITAYKAIMMAIDLKIAATKRDIERLEKEKPEFKITIQKSMYLREANVLIEVIIKATKKTKNPEYN